MQKRLFFCGIGGSGMLPLAMIAGARGYKIAGSDRGFDQGRYPEKAAFLCAKGTALYPQDGSGLQSGDMLVVSTAVEDTIPDVRAARALGCEIRKRAELLADFVNEAPASVAVAGTSGKSTVTGMLAHIAHTAGRAPTVMNGAVMKNFVSDDVPFASALVGGRELFISECDESDGSIALYRPTVGVLNNIALDHKDMDTLTTLFSDYLACCKHTVVNVDDARVAAIARADSLTYGVHNPDARFGVDALHFTQSGSTFTALDRAHKNAAKVTLQVPGAHNVSNALGAIAASVAIGIPFGAACESMESFAGMKRRLEVVGTANSVTVVDDFAHNPDKIAASLDALHLASGRLLILFQMHGFGTLKLLRDELIAAFKTHLHADDKLFLPEALYFGGTVDKSVTMRDVACALNAPYYTDRNAALPDILKAARAGDRIVVMGARDDGLSVYAADILKELSISASS